MQKDYAEKLIEAMKPDSSSKLRLVWAQWVLKTIAESGEISVLGIRKRAAKLSESGERPHTEKTIRILKSLVREGWILSRTVDVGNGRGPSFRYRLNGDVKDVVLEVLSKHSVL